MRPLRVTAATMVCLAASVLPILTPKVPGYLREELVTVVEAEAAGQGVRERVGDFGELRVLLQRHAGDVHVVSGADMIGRVEAMRVGEVGVVHAESGCFLVHELDEGVDAATDVFGELNGGVVAGGQEEAVEQILDGDDHAGLEAHDG